MTTCKKEPPGSVFPQRFSVRISGSLAGTAIINLGDGETHTVRLEFTDNDTGHNGSNKRIKVFSVPL